MKFLVIDSGIGLCHAIRLGKEGHKVYYTNTWWKPFPSFKEVILGTGFEGVEKILSIGDVIDEVDIIIFTDCGYGRLVSWLKNKGYKVIGAPFECERLELERDYMNKICDELEIKRPPSQIIQGIDNLLDFLKKAKKSYFVKLNTVRGDAETFKATSYETAEMILKNMADKIAPFTDEFTFIVEEEVEGVEIGVDTFRSSMGFLCPYFFTFEKLDNTLARVMESSIWDDVLNKLEDYFKKYDYCGAFSLEAIYDGKDVYVIDFTTRFAYPSSSAIECSVIEDYGDLFLNCIKARKKEFKVKSEFAIGVNVYTEEGIGRWLAIDLEKDIDFWVRRGVKIKDKIYLTPGEEGQTLAGVVVGKGDTLEEAFDDASRQLEEIHIYGMTINWGIFDVFVKDYIVPLREYGIDFTEKENKKTEINIKEIISEYVKKKK
jgi:phosphoribosylamine-glycine ligase